MPSTCDICRGNKKVRLPTYTDLEAMAIVDDDADLTASGPGWREFDCPVCVPKVPYRRVRAMKVTTAYPPEVFGKMQMPIERGMAARFGEYLYREGLIKFTTSGSDDMGVREDKITVTAHLGVVAREDVTRSGAVEEIAVTSAPRLPDRILNRAARGRKALQWQPPARPGFDDDPVTDEFDEPKDAMGSRFSGLDIG